MGCLWRQHCGMNENGRYSPDSPSGESFTIIRAGYSGVPVLLAAPHGGRAYPEAVLAAMRDPDYASLKLEDRHADTLAIEVARQSLASLIFATTPRAVIDLNRSSDDIDWTMVSGEKKLPARHSLANRRSRSGLGLVPRRLSGLGEIWKSALPATELKRRIEVIHRPYHRAIADALAELRDRWGAVLLIDIHSMPPLASRHTGERSAEFVIGDRFGASCEPMLSARALSYFEGQDRVVAHNRPYSGGFVLDAHGAPARGIHAMQIEVCRSSYLDAQLTEPSARLPAVARLLAGLVRDMADAVMQLGEGRSPQIAAE